MEPIEDDEKLLDLVVCAALIIGRPRKRRFLHRRTIRSRPWLLDRNKERGIMNFMSFELRDDLRGFHGFLRYKFQ